MKEYKVIYTERKTKFKTCKQYETIITANKIIEARKMAKQEFNKNTDYRVVSVSLVK